MNKGKKKKKRLCSGNLYLPEESFEERYVYERSKHGEIEECGDVNTAVNKHMLSESPKYFKPQLIYCVSVNEILPQAFYDISTEQSTAQALHHVQH